MDRPHGPAVTDERYARHSRLPGWDQGRLAGSTVIVCGLGALGNAAAQSLALAGVGRLILCDMDRIERSNLSRAPLFTESDLGRLKVDAARDALARLAPDIRIDTRPEPLAQGIGLAELRDADLVLGCLDSRAARLELNGRCALVAAPWIDGATGPWSGEVRPYLDPAGPCYACALDPAARATSDPAADERRSCRLPGPPERAGAAAPLSALVGAQQALLAVRRLMGLSTTADLIELDGTTAAAALVRHRRNPACPYHERLPPARRLGLGAESRVADLLARLPAGAMPLAWQPFQIAVRCRRCGFSQAAPGRIEPTACPGCGAGLHPRTSLEIGPELGALRLRDLGIPDREILSVRLSTGLDTIELDTIEFDQAQAT